MGETNISRVGDKLVLSTTFMTDGSPSVFANNIACSGINHAATIPGVKLVVGSPDVFIDA